MFTFLVQAKVEWRNSFMPRSENTGKETKFVGEDVEVVVPEEIPGGDVQRHPE